MVRKEKRQRKFDRARWACVMQWNRVAGKFWFYIHKSTWNPFVYKIKPAGSVFFFFFSSVALRGLLILGWIAQSQSESQWPRHDRLESLCVFFHLLTIIPLLQYPTSLDFRHNWRWDSCVYITCVKVSRVIGAQSTFPAPIFAFASGISFGKAFMSLNAGRFYHSIYFPFFFFFKLTRCDSFLVIELYFCTR